MNDLMNYERPAEPHCTAEDPEQWVRILAWEEERADKAETQLAEAQKRIESFEQWQTDAIKHELELKSQLAEAQAKVKELEEERKEIFKAGYHAGNTAYNTAGPASLDHIEMHLEEWKECQ